MFEKFSFWGGVGIVIATHLWILKNGLPQKQIKAHSAFNLGASFLIILGKFKK